MQSLTIEPFMSHPPVTLDVDDTMERATRLFEKHGFHHLLVVETRRISGVERKHLVGVISDRDLLEDLSPFAGSNAAQSRDNATLNKRIHQIMTRQVISIRTSTTLPAAAHLMLDKNISCLPVVDEHDRPIGILTSRDLLKAWALLDRPKN